MPALPPDTLVDGRYRIIGRIGSGGMADVYEAEDTQLGRADRAQAALPALRRGPGLRRALPPRGVERRRAEPPERRPGLRPRRVGRHLLHRDGAARGPQPQGHRARVRRARAGGGGRHRAADPARGAVRAPARRRPPRHQAAQRDRRRRGPREGHRLRDRPRRQLGHDRDGPDHGHGAVHLARAGPGPPGRRALRPLLDRRRALRAADRARCPFDAESAVSIALKQVSEEPVPPRVRNPAVPPALEAVTLRALRKDPYERYQDADQFIAALEQAEAGVIADDPVAELEARDERSWRRIALIALAVLALVAIAVGAFLLLTPDQKRVPDVVGDRTQNATEKLQKAGLRGLGRADPVRRRGRGPRRRAAPVRRRRGGRGVGGHDHRVERAGRGADPGRPGPERRRRGRPAGRGRLPDRAAARVLRHGRQGPGDRDLAAGGDERPQGLEGDDRRVARPPEGAGAGRRRPVAGGRRGGAPAGGLRRVGDRARGRGRRARDGALPGSRRAARRSLPARRSSSSSRRRRRTSRCPACSTRRRTTPATRSRTRASRSACATRDVDTPDQDGIVVDQDPEPDSTAAPGLAGDDHRRALRDPRRPTPTPTPTATP